MLAKRQPCIPAFNWVSGTGLTVEEREWGKEETRGIMRLSGVWVSFRGLTPPFSSKISCYQWAYMVCKCGSVWQAGCVSPLCVHLVCRRWFLCVQRKFGGLLNRFNDDERGMV